MIVLPTGLVEIEAGVGGGDAAMSSSSGLCVLVLCFLANHVFVYIKLKEMGSRVICYKCLLSVDDTCWQHSVSMYMENSWKDTMCLKSSGSSVFEKRLS
ncbi:hypothetical protein MUK42_23520 [Musa troglodytarum]|uniref:Uncharacterized protein n=1 Tax=Musa troglodytarum TaxID=320322 RepID=A0A9E7K8Z1_9LILI|nr:hypothetical protein MUK42_23520 [Musa troglodytarum]